MMRKLLGVIEIELGAFAGPHFRLVLDDELAALRADFVEIRRRWDGMSAALRDEFAAAVIGGTCEAFWETHADLWSDTPGMQPDAHLGAVGD